MSTDIILVDENDVEIGTAEKQKAHQEGLLHRAFSVFIYQNDKLLLQKRHSHKYHSAGLWTNTCCSHPYPNEDIKTAAVRRVQEELGISLSLDSLIELGVFHYTEQVGNNLIENELDHVFIVRMPENNRSEQFRFDFNQNEISEVKWITIQELQLDLQKNPDDYSVYNIKYGGLYATM
jgi:isopentenyl-diphosphate delta-isomerase type 1